MDVTFHETTPFFFPSPPHLQGKHLSEDEDLILDTHLSLPLSSQPPSQPLSPGSLPSPPSTIPSNTNCDEHTAELQQLVLNPREPLVYSKRKETDPRPTQV